MAYTITDSVYQVSQSLTQSCTLTNGGTAPIYLGDSTALSALNYGLVLSPRQSMQWAAGPLYAVCAPGESSALNVLFSGGATFSPIVNVDGPVTVTGDVGIDGPVTVSGTVEIGAPVTVNGTVDIGSPVTVTGDVGIDGPVSVYGNVGVSGPVTVNGAVDANITGPVDANITGPVSVTGTVDADITGPVSVSGPVTVNGAVVASNRVTLIGTYSNSVMSSYVVDTTGYASVILEWDSISAVSGTATPLSIGTNWSGFFPSINSIGYWKHARYAPETNTVVLSCHSDTLYLTLPDVADHVGLSVKVYGSATPLPESRALAGSFCDAPLLSLGANGFGVNSANSLNGSTNDLRFRMPSSLDPVRLSYSLIGSTMGGSGYVIIAEHANGNLIQRVSYPPGTLSPVDAYIDFPRLVGPYVIRFANRSTVTYSVTFACQFLNSRQ